MQRQWMLYSIKIDSSSKYVLVDCNICLQILVSMLAMILSMRQGYE